LDYERASLTRFELSNKEMQHEIIQKDFLAIEKIFPKGALVMDSLHFVLVLLGQVISIIPSSSNSDSWSLLWSPAV